VRRRTTSPCPTVELAPLRLRNSGAACAAGIEGFAQILIGGVAQRTGKTIAVRLDGFDIEIAPAKVHGRIAVDAVEQAPEPVLQRILDEHGCLAQQIDFIPVTQHHFAILGDALVHAAKHELRKQSIAAIVEVRGIGHLRNDVGGADQLPEAPLQWRCQRDRLDIGLVTGELHQATRQPGIFLQADLRQVLAEEAAAARDVDTRVLGAVTPARVGATPDITRVVAQRDYHAEQGHRVRETRRTGLDTQVTVEQAHHGQGDIEYVVEIVVTHLAGVVARVLALVKTLYIAEGLLHLCKRLMRVVRGKQPGREPTHGSGVGYVDPTRYIKLVRRKIRNGHRLHSHAAWRGLRQSIVGLRAPFTFRYRPEPVAPISAFPGTSRRSAISLLAALLATLAGCAGYTYTLNERTVFEGPKPFRDFDIADNALRACVEQAIIDQGITAAAALEDLNCSQAGIADLAGLEVFSGLRRIGLDGNAITDLTALHAMGELKLLHLRDNRLRSLDAGLCNGSKKEIALAGNDALACADIAMLEACGTVIIDRPAHCN
jgi:hypothetical protein